MARAKRTERAEARKRYRATQVTEVGAADRDASSEHSPSGRSPSEPPTSLVESARRAIGRFHMPDFGADLQAVPGVAREKPLILLPFGLLVVGAIVAAVLPRDQVNGAGIASLYVQLAFLQPTLLFFAVGFLVPRGAYLFGALLGLLASVLFVVLALGLIGMFATLDTMSVTDRVLYSLWQLVQFVLTGAIFGWFASWYRDFLRRSQARSREAAEARKRAQRRDSRRPEAKRAR